MNKPARGPGSKYGDIFTPHRVGGVKTPVLLKFDLKEEGDTTGECRGNRVFHTSALPGPLLRSGVRVYTPLGRSRAWDLFKIEGIEGLHEVFQILLLVPCNLLLCFLEPDVR